MALEDEVKKEEIENLEIKEEKEEIKEEDNKVEEEYNGPVVKTITRYDYRTMKYFNMYNMQYRRHISIVYFIFGLLSLGFCGYSVVNALGAEQLDIFRFVISAIFLLFGVYFIYQSIFFEKVIDKNIQMHFYKNPKVVELEVTVTEREVTLQINGNQKGELFAYDWAYVTDIVEIPQYYFLYIQKQPIIIEKDPNKVFEGDYETLEAIIKEKTTTKPYKKIEKELVKRPITYVHEQDLNDASEVEVTDVADSNETDENNNE